jgi:hypothetical protein
MGQQVQPPSLQIPRFAELLIPFLLAEFRALHAKQQKNFDRATTRGHAFYWLHFDSFECINH